MTRGRIPLNENHRRALSSTLSILDETLCTFERMLEGKGESGVLHSERDDIDESRKKLIKTEIEALRAILVNVRDELGLRKETRRFSMTIWASCACLLDQLAELEPENMQRYGDVPPSFPSYFAPLLREMMRRLSAISALSRSER